MSDALPPLRLFLDRSTQSKRFIAAVRELVDDVVTINDRYGTKAAEDIPDIRWIAEASAEERVLIGADRNILRNRLERHAICRSSARYVVFSNSNMPVRRMAELFEQHLPDIHELAMTPGPWAHRIAQHGIGRLSLNCDDL